MNHIQRVMRPETYHGAGRKPPFFEGWYFKLVSADEQHKIAIIPGVIFGEDEHAFIQLLDGVAASAMYFTLPVQAFEAQDEPFLVSVGHSQFSLRSIQLNVSNQHGSIQGKIEFDGVQGWPVTLTSPGVMGWYGWIPGMECYHGVLGFDHGLRGSLTVNGREIDFTGGRGYIEKDWGQSFPAAWVWMQSNHFGRPGLCLSASVAIIPWRGAAFPGFIIGFWMDGILYRFASYTGAKIDSLKVDDTAVRWTVSDSRYTLQMTASRAETGLLKGPTKLEMGKRVAESLAATVEVRLTRKTGELIFEGTGKHTGLEVFDTEKLVAMLGK